MLGKLSETLKKTTDRIANAIFLDKNLVDGIVRDLQRALIEADVNIPLIKTLTDKLKKAAFDERIKDIDKKEHLIKLLHEELLKILGENKKINLSEKQNRIMLLGLYGSGKTTTTAKLANYFSKRGKKVAMIGLDVHRPAAAEQLKQLGEKIKVTTFTKPDEKSPEKIWKYYEPELKKYDLVLIDTAGRHNLDKDLIKEIKSISKKTNPTETILVLPADIGQTAKTQASEFQEAIKVSGVIITRMDSTAKAGGALTACYETNAPIYFIGTGEKTTDIEEFNPDSFLSRLLGMGDLTSLIEKIKSVTDEKSQLKLKEKLEQGKLSLTDIVEQSKSMGALGGLDKIKSMIPGLGKAKIPENLLDTQQTKIAKWEHILNSMTKNEKENPELLKKNTSRINRISKGSGTTSSEVRSLLKQHQMLSDMIGSGENMDMSEGMDMKKMQKLMKKFGKTKKIRF